MYLFPSFYSRICYNSKGNYLEMRLNVLQIRQATVQDAPQIAPLIYDAIGEIANQLTNQSTFEGAISGIQTLIEQTNNRHTYLNTYVAEEHGQLLGVVVLYDGATGNKLDAEHARAYKIDIDVEAHHDEYYIDTVCVHSSARGQGIGTKLLQFAEEKARTLGYSKLSLNVELEKVKARKLYERMGFVVTEPWTIIGEPFHHMVKEI